MNLATLIGQTLSQFEITAKRTSREADGPVPITVVTNWIREFE